MKIAILSPFSGLKLQNFNRKCVLSIKRQFSELVRVRKLKVDTNDVSTTIYRDDHTRIFPRFRGKWGRFCPYFAIFSPENANSYGFLCIFRGNFDLPWSSLHLTEFLMIFWKSLFLPLCWGPKLQNFKQKFVLFIKREFSELVRVRKLKGGSNDVCTTI